MSFINLIGTFLITSLSLFALKPMANRVGLIDIPGGRKQHKAPTPLIGGVGIYAGTLFMCLLTPSLLLEYAGLLATSALVLFVGIFDDARELRVSVRIGLHAFAAWLMAALAGTQLHTLGDLTGFGVIELGVLAIPLTIFATVGVINAVNMVDGVDGLSGGLVLITLACLGIVALDAGHIPMVEFVTLLACALLAFLVMNFRAPWKQSALIYLGDAGSTMLGFMLTWLVLEATQGQEAFLAPVYALWFLAIPLLDTVSLLIKRPLRGKSPFSAGHDHLHHRLLRAGFTLEQTVLGLYLASSAFGAIGLVAHFNNVSEALMFGMFLAIFAIYMVWGTVADARALRTPGTKLHL
jgi:UDP-GlcNAc:undecaprenyl-phosphate/decaprenyl-phosphate GlcNAc-1-phosphate transferase